MFAVALGYAAILQPKPDFTSMPLWDGRTSLHNVTIEVALLRFV